MYSANQPVPLQFRHIIDYDDTVGIDVDQSVADMAIADVPCNGVVLFSACLITEVITADETAPVFKFDHRVTAGSDTNRTDGTLGAITIPDATAAGAVVYDEAGKGQRVYAGDQVVFQYTTKASESAGITGHVVPLLVIDPEWDMLANLTGWSETA